MIITDDNDDVDDDDDDDEDDNDDGDYDDDDDDDIYSRFPCSALSYFFWYLSCHELNPNNS